ncbi:hypothetical protein MSAN_01815000 [Mycena sanguinolenta]|uniref:MYND-type domain-containing protein n=1 Tax=Mycena sanguinolenta TaxID=230812 RepID=A0A8H7CQT6_9AGAR|nr:hypothetical protein MSAN_01815000 [Mycena sanguinolenta]
MDAFNPNCPHCVAERSVAEQLTRDVPSAPCHRHVKSDPKETQRKELTQCQYCFKSRGPGVTLQRCGACEVDLYCSKECQRAAWKTHKRKCAINRANAKIMSKTALHTLKALSAFTAKHRPTLAEAGIRALGVVTDPSRAERDLLVILLRPRLDSPRVETTFWVTAASVVPMSTFPQAEEMRNQLKLANEANKPSGMAGALFVMLMEIEGGTTNLAPVGFPKVAPELLDPASAAWEAWLTTRLNEGVVV